MKKVRKSSHRSVEIGAKPMEVMKLSVALNLCLEGYDEVTFNKRFGTGSRQVCVHVFAEDTVGSKVAVYCISRTELAKRDSLVDVVYRIADYVDGDCQIAVAIPLRLLNMVHEIKDVVYRIYMVDEDGRVWVHDPSRHFGVSRLRAEVKDTYRSAGHYSVKMQRLTPCERIQYVV
jgi:hypothetical protein